MTEIKTFVVLFVLLGSYFIIRLLIIAINTENPLEDEYKRLKASTDSAKRLSDRYLELQMWRAHITWRNHWLDSLEELNKFVEKHNYKI